MASILQILLALILLLATSFLITDLMSMFLNVLPATKKPYSIDQKHQK
jgi:hypothetical protein